MNETSKFEPAPELVASVSPRSNGFAYVDFAGKAFPSGDVATVWSGLSGSSYTEKRVEFAGAQARRLAACWNALRDLPIESVERIAAKVNERLARRAGE